MCMRGTRCKRARGPVASMHVGTWCMCACMHAWGPSASMRGDLLQACVHGDLVQACVRGDPVQVCMREPSVCVCVWGPGACMHVGTHCMCAWDPVRAWGSSRHGTRVGTQHMKGAFGVQKVVSEDEVESMYYLPYKPSTGA